MSRLITRRSLFAAGIWAGLGLPLAARAASTPMPEAYDIAFSTWTDDEPFYAFYPGDKIEILVPAAPELNRQTQVGPDGRITLPLLGQIMAAYKTAPQLQDEITARYADGILISPSVQVSPGETVQMKVIVGGEVKTPGWIEMTGDMDALQAVFAAGGFLSSAKRQNVTIIRRGRDGGAMRKVVDLKSPLSGQASQMVALRRFDIVYVPKSGIATADDWVNSWVNALIPGGILNYFAYRTFK